MIERLHRKAPFHGGAARHYAELPAVRSVCYSCDYAWKLYRAARSSRYWLVLLAVLGSLKVLKSLKASVFSPVALPCLFAMVFDSDSTQSQPQPAESLQSQTPKKGRRPSLFEWGSRIIKEVSECDAKTLAARRKRSEIRRLKLKAAADEQEERVEPLPKRLKTISKAAHDQRGHSMSTFGELRGRQPDDEVIRASNAGVITAAGKSMADAGLHEVSNMGARQEEATNKDDEGGSVLKSRLAVSGTYSACSAHCVVSICGRTRFMEDAAIAVPSFISMPSSAAQQGGIAHTDTFHFYGVYDGHGGPQAAEICKERMHGMLAEEMSIAANSSPSHVEACMQTCFKRLDDELCGVCPHGSECPCKAGAGSTSINSSCREPLVPGSVGTTAVVAVVGANHIVVGNCGDSRAVLCRGGEAVPLSIDHKANRPDEVARIEAAGGHVFTWEGHRVCGVLAMSRALGDGFLKPFVSGQPEVMITERRDDDECLILASDGLWDVLSSKFVCSVARKAMANWRTQHIKFRHRYPLFAHNSVESYNSEEQEMHGDADVEDSPAQVVAAMLVKLALAKNSKDNISVVVVDLKRS